jgi:hypothetical protein
LRFDDLWLVYIQNYVWQLSTPSKMAATTEIPNINKGQLKKFLFLVMAVTLDEEQGC